MWRNCIYKIKETLKSSDNNILFGFLALFSVAIYFFYFGTNQPEVLLGEHNPEVSWWYVPAVMAFLCLCKILYSKGMLTGRFIIVCTFILAELFIALQHILHGTGKNIIIQCVMVLIGIICLWRLIKEKKNGLTWIMPLILVLSFEFAPQGIGGILVWIGFALIFMAISCRYDIYKKSKKLKSCLFAGILCFTLLTSYVYCDFNPLLTYKMVGCAYTTYYWNIDNPVYSQARELSDNGIDKWNFADGAWHDVCSRETSLLKKEQDKWILVDGKSLFGNKIVKNTFDNKGYDSSLKIYSMVFFLNNAEKKYKLIGSSLYPITLNDTLIAFPASASFYKSLKNYIQSDFKNQTSNDSDNRNAISARIFFDYMNAFQYKDKESLSQLKADYVLLKNELLKLSTDSSAFVQSRILSKKEFINDDNIYNPDSRVHLSYMTQNMALGILTSIGLDLLEKDELESAVELFSYQFLLSFYYDNNIYGTLPIQTNVSLDLKLGNETIWRNIKISRANLNSFEEIDTWAEVFLFSTSIALKYVAENHFQPEDIIKSLEKSLASETGGNISKQQRLKNATDILKNEINAFNNYQNTPNTKEFCNAVRSFLFECSVRNYYPSYNSYFLNRFNEIYKVIPLEDISKKEVEGIRTIYIDRIRGSLNELDTLSQKLEGYDRILQRRIEILNRISDPEIRKSVEKIFDEM